ncbi:MAG: endonuclease/exonuclease/phosphatase family protein [Pseudomonadota bacterium]
MDNASHFAVLTHNIHKAVSPFSRRSSLTALAREIAGSGADLVFLQEIRGADRQTPGPGQPQRLAEALGFQVVYGKNAVYARGHHGNAILSRYPLEFLSNQDLSLSKLEQRGLLHARTRLPNGQQIHLFCLHLNLRKVDQAHQLTQVIAHLRQELPPGEPVLLAGDFNDWSELLSDRLEGELDLQEAGLSANGRHARSFPSLLPVLSLDRIYYRGLALEDFAVLDGPDWRLLSDHLPLKAAFTLTS